MLRCFSVTLETIIASTENNDKAATVERPCIPKMMGADKTSRWRKAKKPGGVYSQPGLTCRLLKKERAKDQNSRKNLRGLDKNG